MDFSGIITIRQDVVGEHFISTIINESGNVESITGKANPRYRKSQNIYAATYEQKYVWDRPRFFATVNEALIWHKAQVDALAA